MSRMLWKGLLVGATGASIPVDAESQRVREAEWHAFVSGVFAGASLQIQYSPDTPEISDAASTWYAPAVLAFAAGGDTFFKAKPRKLRPVVTGGGGTTAINVEIR